MAVGRNYADHAGELGLPVPRIFFKPPSGVIAPGDAIRLPPSDLSGEVHHEAELAVVIGTACRNVAATDAPSYVFGYTCANDVTARDIQRRDGMPDFAKSFDTFCPLGPWIETEADVATSRVRCVLNGEVRQDGVVSGMLTPVPELVSFISRAMTLLPGDVILTGTPAGVGELRAGDEVTVEIDGVGRLTNPVR
ncbi:MAG: fumarylacetoacetate hydrolase family protein [Nocardioides sp.]